MAAISQVYNDPSLYGHALTSLPEYVWNVATASTPVSYYEPDPGSAERVYLIFENFKVTKKDSNGNVTGYIFGTNSLLFKYLEIGVRGIVGSLLAATLYLTAAPIGLAIKTIHMLGAEFAKAARV